MPQGRDTEASAGGRALPGEAADVLCGAPSDFVAARDALARELRAEGREADAAVVSALRKPTAVVFAANRAARERSETVSEALGAADAVRRAQLSGEAEVFQDALGSLERSLSVLVGSALGQLAEETRPTDAMRRRLADHLRAAVADPATGAALQAGLLTSELDPKGFEPFAGMPVPVRRAPRASEREKSSRAVERETRTAQLREELDRAEKALRHAEREVQRATRERDRAARDVSALRAKLDRARGT